MSLLIDQLAAYLQAQGQGTVGTDVFKVRRPSSPLACLSLHPTGGYPPDRYTAREKPTLMIYARAGSPDDALRKAYSVFNLLHRSQHLDLGGGLCALTIEAVGSPAYLGTERAGEQTGHLAAFNAMLDLRTASS